MSLACDVHMVGELMLNYSFILTVMGHVYENLEYSLFQSTLFPIYTLKLGLLTIFYTI